MITVGNLILDLTAAALLPTFFWHLFMVSAEGRYRAASPFFELQDSSKATLCFPEYYFFHKLSIKTSGLSTHLARTAPTCLSDNIP